MHCIKNIAFEVQWVRHFKNIDTYIIYEKRWNKQFQLMLVITYAPKRGYIEETPCTTIKPMLCNLQVKGWDIILNILSYTNAFKLGDIPTAYG